MPGPLEGVRVVDCSRVIAGPMAAMLLADQGAEVNKIEAPGYGEEIRIAGFRRAGMCAFFANVNRGKRSIVLDLKQPNAQQIARRLVERADVFLQNFRPGAAERIGLGEAALRAINPDLIYASISGFGDTGPYRDRPVYDPVIQALTGHIAVQVNPEIPIPDLVRNLVADKATGLTAAQAITAALFARDRGAGGQHVRVPMLDASLAFFWPDGMWAHTLLGEGVEPGLTLYQTYRLVETADGRIVCFPGTDAHFHALFRAFGRPELAQDPRYATFAARQENAEPLGTLLAEEFAKWRTADLVPRLIAEEVPVAPVLSLEEVLEDPQIRHNGILVEQNHPVAGRIRQAGPAARFDKTPTRAGRFPPLHGEHTDEILAELGIEAAERQALREEGSVA